MKLIYVPAKSFPTRFLLVPFFVMPGQLANILSSCIFCFLFSKVHIQSSGPSSREKQVFCSFPKVDLLLKKRNPIVFLISRVLPCTSLVWVFKTAPDSMSKKMKIEFVKRQSFCYFFLTCTKCSPKNTDITNKKSFTKSKSMKLSRRHPEVIMTNGLLLKNKSIPIMCVLPVRRRSLGEKHWRWRRMSLTFCL